MENPQQTPPPTSDPLLELLSKHVSELPQNAENPARAARCRRALELASVLISYANGNAVHVLDQGILAILHVDDGPYGDPEDGVQGLTDFLDGYFVAVVPHISASAV